MAVLAFSISSLCSASRASIRATRPGNADTSSLRRAISWSTFSSSISFSRSAFMGGTCFNVNTRESHTYLTLLASFRRLSGCWSAPAFWRRHQQHGHMGDGGVVQIQAFRSFGIDSQQYGNPLLDLHAVRTNLRFGEYQSGIHIGHDESRAANLLKSFFHKD